MSTFRLYLWKEWREQRGALFALALMLPVLVAAIGFSMPRSRASGGTFMGVTSAVALVLTLVVVSGELLSFDRRRGGQWLERLPRGVAAAFPAKLSVFLGSSVLALAYGALLSLVVGLLRSRSPANAIALERDLEPMLIPIGCALAVAPWVFSASAWCTRGMLAFVAGTVLAAGLGFPLLAFGLTDYQPAPGELDVAVTLFLGGALVSAWLGFVHGPSLGRSLGRTAWVGGGSGALALAPIFGWGVFQLRERDALDLASPNCRVESIWVSADSRFAWISARMHSPRWRYTRPERLLRVDLDRKSATEVGAPSSFQFVSFYSDMTKPSDCEPSALMVQDAESLWFVDANGSRMQRPPTEHGDELCDLKPAGLGWNYYERGHGNHYHDPFAGVTRSLDELGMHEWTDVAIGPAGWWIDQGDGSSWLTPTNELVEHRPEGPFAYDARNDELVLRPELDSVRDVKLVLADGRMFAKLDDGSYGLVDLVQGTIEPLVIHPADRGRIDPFWAYPTRSPQTWLVHGWPRNYCLDLEKRVLVPLDDSYSGRIVRCLPDHDVVFLTEEGLVRRDDETGMRTTLVRFAELAFETEVLP